MKVKKILAGLLTAGLIFSTVGCGNTNKEVKGKVNITVGNWPPDTDPEQLAEANKMRDEFMSLNPDINIITDTTYYDSKTLNMKGSANQLATLYATPITELSSIIRNGYGANIKKYMEEYGYADAMNPEVYDLLKGSDGGVYAIPYSVYRQGFYINKTLFKESGLIDENGEVKTPKTWQEVAEFAKTIKEKTGKAGFVYPTTNNCGGWQFMNIAWSYGVEFEKQRDDGSYEATFNTPECVEAMQFIKDLKWKYDVLVDDMAIGQIDLYKYFGTNQAAMMIADPPCNWLYKDYNMSKDNAYVIGVPAGPEGSYSQMGADIWVISPDASEEQIEACFKWIDFRGYGPSVSDEQFKNLQAIYKAYSEQGSVVLDRDPFEIWKSGEAAEKRNEARAAYININPDDYAVYYDSIGVKVKPEPPACAQQLYAVLDSVIQEVLTNKDADVKALIENACKDFQVNHLDKM